MCAPKTLRHILKSANVRFTATFKLYAKQVVANAQVLASRFDNLREGALAVVTGTAPASASTLPAGVGVANVASAASGPATPALR